MATSDHQYIKKFYKERSKQTVQKKANEERTTNEEVQGAKQTTKKNKKSLWAVTLCYSQSNGQLRGTTQASEVQHGVIWGGVITS